MVGTLCTTDPLDLANGVEHFVLRDQAGYHISPDCAVSALLDKSHSDDERNYLVSLMHSGDLGLC